MKSLWKTEVKAPQFQNLCKDVSTDVVVIGGGIAGILCAHELCARGIDCLLVEAEQICSGVTGNTTAKITAQHGLIYSKIARTYGSEAAELYYTANAAGVRYWERICAGIPCEMIMRDSFVYSLRGKETLSEELSVLRSIGADAEFVKTKELPLPISGAIRVPQQYQVHPLKALYGIAASLPIFEKTRVKAIRNSTVITDRGQIHARRIVIATHFPMIQSHGFYFLKIYQSRSYVLALKGAGKVEGMYIDEAEDGMSFRSSEDYLLLGGGSHRTGKRHDGWQTLSHYASRYYPNAECISKWATQDCMSLDGLPYVGRYSLGTKEIYVATGFGKWGMSLAAVSASVIADLLSGVKNPLADLFSPSRHWMHLQLLKNVGETALDFLNPTPRRCPHMGCALRWNREERSWDCPCHGSRFSKNGEVLNEPAKKMLKK